MKNDRFYSTPGIEKIAEAWSAIASGRVKINEANAEVVSSSGDKTYRITWENDAYYSDDPSSRWHGRLGYPIIAVLTVSGKLPFDRKSAEYFADVKWKELNKKHKNDYAAAFEEVLRKAREKGEDRGRLIKALSEAAAALEKIPVKRKTSASAPRGQGEGNA